MSTFPLPAETPAAGFIPTHQLDLDLAAQAGVIAVPHAADPIRVLVSGSRDFANETVVASVLWRVSVTYGPLHITDGMAEGLDELANLYAISQDWTYERIGAPWHMPCRPECHHGPRRHGRRSGPMGYCPAAGNYRNQTMVDKGHDLCIGWFSKPESAGTIDCLTRAHMAGIPTFTVQWEEADLFTSAQWAVRRFLARP